jgi:hypothetical protein
MREKAKMNQMIPARPRRSDDGLGPNSDIGAKLRALYGQVESEGTPDWLLDLLERLDETERSADAPASQRK